MVCDKRIMVEKMGREMERIKEEESGGTVRGGGIQSAWQWPNAEVTRAVVVEGREKSMSQQELSEDRSIS